MCSPCCGPDSSGKQEVNLRCRLGLRSPTPQLHSPDPDAMHATRLPNRHAMARAVVLNFIFSMRALRVEPVAVPGLRKRSPVCGRSLISSTGPRPAGKSSIPPVARWGRINSSRFRLLTNSHVLVSPFGDMGGIHICFFVLPGSSHACLYLCFLTVCK
jgi:hypothetical protein